MLSTFRSRPARRVRLRLLIACCIVVAAVQTAATHAADSVELDVVTFNVLVDLGAPKGMKPWTERRELCVHVLREADPDLLGLQEPLPRQVDYLLEHLPGYSVVNQPDYTDATLFYKTDLFEELDRGLWWLSPTPEKRSTGFGNFLPRLVVWAKLKHRPSGKPLYVFNTHFDNSLPSQIHMAELCQKQLAPFVETGLPMIFMGDFNTDQKRGDYSKLVSGGWRDSYTAAPEASEDGRDDNVATYYEGSKRRIDHIFYHGDELEPIAWRRLESPDPEIPLSDHYPVHARFRWK